MKKLLLHRHMTAAAILASAALTMTACGSSKSAVYVNETAAVRMEDREMESIDNADSAEGLSSSSGTITVLPASRKLIRNASLDVETDQFDNLIRTITGQIAVLQGYVEDSAITGANMDYYNEPRRRYASITARVPQEKLDSFVAVVEQNGNVTSRNESTTDVTLQYSDMESKKKSLTMEQERIWDLLEKAESLDAVIALEKRLSEIRYELESMESQLRLYENQVEYSTVTLNINEVKTFTPTSPESVGERIQKGLAKNASGMVDFLTGFFIWLVTTSPIWLPLAIIAAVITFFVRKSYAKKAFTDAAKGAELFDSAETNTDTTKDHVS